MSDAMLGWAQSMTWKGTHPVGAHPVIELNQSISHSKDVALTGTRDAPYRATIGAPSHLAKVGYSHSSCLDGILFVGNYLISQT